MSLVERDEESQTQESSPMSGYDKDNNIGPILKIVGVVIVVLAITGIIFWPKVSTASTLYIDNPTDVDVFVKIDDLFSATIPANSHVETNLKPGDYSLFVDDEAVGSFRKGIADGKSFLNPTKSTYVLEEAAYTVDESVEAPSNDVTITINEEEFYGPFTIYDDYYVTGNWEYSIDDTAPEEVTTTGDYTIVKKIYRLEDFFNMYDSDYASY